MQYLTLLNTGRIIKKSDKVTQPLTHDLRDVLSQVHHGRRHEPTVSSIENQVHRMLQLDAYLFRVCHDLFRLREAHARGHHRLPQRWGVG